MIILLLVHVWATYVQILDPIVSLHLDSSDTAPSPRLASSGQFDRSDIGKEYTLTGWFQVESFQYTAPNDLIGILSGTTWYPCITQTDTNTVTVIYAAQQLHFTYNIGVVTWYFIAAWVNVETSQFGICIDDFVRSGFQCRTETFYGEMATFDRSTFKIDYSIVISGNVQTIGQKFDIRLYNEVLANAASIDATYTITACHSHCKNSCWGPANTSCDDFIQVTQAYEPWQIVDFISFNPDTNYFQQRTDYGINNSFSGWILEDSATTERVDVFGTLSDNCPFLTGLWVNCHHRHVFYNEIPTTDYVDNAPNIDYQDGVLAQGRSIFEGYDANSARQEWNLIIASFSDQNSMSICHFSASQGTNWQAYDMISAPAWTVTWPDYSDSGIVNTLTVGSASNTWNAHVADVRYYLNKSLSYIDFVSLAVNANVRRSPGCSNDACDACQNGYFYDSSDEVWYMWHQSWATCDGASDLDCLTCASGYKRLQTENWCTTVWPTGSTDVADVCQFQNAKIMEYKFDSFDQTFYDKIHSVPGVLGSSDLIESSDAIVLKERGFYFDGVQHQVILDYNPSGFVLPPTISVFFWGRFTVIQERYILGRFGKNNLPLFSFEMSTSGVAFTIKQDNEIGTSSATYIPDGIWNHFGVTCQFGTSQLSLIACSLMIQGSYGPVASIWNNSIIGDAEYNKFLIGTGFDTNGASQTYMEGQIYDFVVYNYAFSAGVDSILNDTSGSDACSGTCPFCPTDTLDCISTCNVDEFIQSDGSCSACLPECSSGCVNSSDCSLCEDDNWSSCNGFGLNQCSECEDGSTPSSGECPADACDDDYWLSCNGSGKNQCTECKSTFILQNGTCQWYLNIVNETWVDWVLHHHGNWVYTCPNGWIPDIYGEVCIPCPANCSIWSSQTSCQVCTYPNVLREDKLCYDSCLSGQFADGSGECVDCFDTCETCIAGSSEDWLECPTGLVRSDESVGPSSWLCVDTSQSTKLVKFACVDQQIDGNKNPVEILNSLAELIDTENLTEAEFQRVTSQVSRTELYNTQLLQQGMDVVNQAALNVMLNGATQITAVTDYFDVIWRLDTQQNLQGARILSSTSSGVQIPLNLVEETYATADAEFIVNVIQLKSDEQDSVPHRSDVVMVEIYEVVSDTEMIHLHFSNMNNNFTIIFNEQQFDTTKDYEWVYLESGSWDTSGCTRTYMDETQAQCDTNHLSSFSMQEASRSANTDTNAETSIDFEAAENYDITTNITPFIVVSSILLIYFVVFFFLRRRDMRSRRIGLTDKDDADDIHAMAIAFQKTLEAGQNMNQSESPSSQSQSSESESPMSSVESGVLSPVVEDSLESFWSVQQQDDIPPELDLSVDEFIPTRPQIAEPPKAWRESTDTLKSLRRATDEIIADCEKTMAIETEEDQHASHETISEVTFRNQDEGSGEFGLNKGTTITVEGVPLEETSPEKMSKKSLKRQFSKIHPLIGIFTSVDKSILRTERWTIFLAIVMVSLYVTGLFYNTDYDEEEEKKQSEQSISESFTSFSWNDFWIIVYTTLITVPLPFILRYFFRRRKPDPNKNVMKQLRFMKIKRIIGYILVTLIVVWCLWATIAFSLAFGTNTTQHWMLSFTLTEIFDFTLKDNIVTLIIALTFVCISRQRSKKNMKMTTVFPQPEN